MMKYQTRADPDSRRLPPLTNSRGRVMATRSLR